MEKVPNYVLFDGISRPAQELPKGVEPSFTVYPNLNYRNLQDTKFDMDAVDFLLKECTVYNAVTKETDFKRIPKKDLAGKSVYAFAKNAPFSLDYSFRDFVPLNKEESEALYRVLPKGFVLTRAQLVEYGVLLQRRYDYLIAEQEYKAKQEAKYKPKEVSSDIKPHVAQAIPFAQLQKLKEDESKKQKPTTAVVKAIAPASVVKAIAPKASAANPATVPITWPTLSSASVGHKTDKTVDRKTEAPVDREIEVRIYHADQLSLFEKLVKEESDRNQQARKKLSF